MSFATDLAPRTDNKLPSGNTLMSTPSGLTNTVLGRRRPQNLSNVSGWR